MNRRRQIPARDKRDRGFESFFLLRRVYKLSVPLLRGGPSGPRLADELEALGRAFERTEAPGCTMPISRATGAMPSAGRPRARGRVGSICAVTGLCGDIVRTAGDAPRKGASLAPLAYQPLA